MLPVQLTSVKTSVYHLWGSGNLAARGPWCQSAGPNTWCACTLAAWKMLVMEPNSFLQLACKQATNFTGS